jgi:hypothetical protein
VPTPTLRRRNSGKYHYYVDSSRKRVPGVTTILGTTLPKPALVPWAATATATFAVDNLATLGELDREAAIELAKKAPDRDRDQAARRGSEVHDLAQRLTAGEAVDVPDEIAGHVEAYLAFTHDWQPRELLVEQAVYQPTLRYAGTLDVIADLADGRRWLLDYKTNRKGPFPETALQLTAYRYADYCGDGSGPLTHMPDVDAAGIVWLRADGTFDLIPADTSPPMLAVWRRLCALYPRLIDADDWLGESLAPPTPTTTAGEVA